VIVFHCGAASSGSRKKYPPHFAIVKNSLFVKSIILYLISTENPKGLKYSKKFLNFIILTVCPGPYSPSLLKKGRKQGKG
jgi:hypothetical protein